MKPEDLQYRETHEWLAVEGEGDSRVATIGISAFAVEALTDVVYLELPQVGQKFEAGQDFGKVESVKAVSDLYCPANLEVTEVNEQLTENLEWLSSDPYGQGWIIKGRLLDDASLSELMDFDRYQKQCAEEG